MIEMTGPRCEHQHVSTDDMPRLQDLFRAADENALVDAAFEAQRFENDCRPFSNKKTRRKIVSNMKHAIGQMRNLTIERTARTFVFIPSGIYSIGRHGQILYCIEANLMDMANLENVKRYLKMNPTVQDPSKRRPASPDLAGNAPWTEEHSKTYAFEFIPWKKVLGYGIWIPQDYCQKERYLFLASIFNEMTFLGTDAHRSRTRQKKVLARLRKSALGPTVGRIDGHDDHPPSMLFPDYGLGPPDDMYSSLFIDRQMRFLDCANHDARIEMYRSFVDLGRRHAVLTSSKTTSV